LSICRRLAEALDGGITVTSELGKGSVFTLVMDPGDVSGVPILRAEDAPDTDIETAAEAGEIRFDASLPPVRVLVADDGESNRKLIRLVLERAGVVVQAVENGAEAVNLATRETFDIILMDMNMPVMDGFTATRTLREQGCKLPILAMTADAMKGSEERCRAAGCSGFLTKPIDMDRVLRVVASTLGRTTTKLAAGAPPDSRSDRPAALPQALSNATSAASSPSSSDPIVTTLPATDPVMCEIVGEFVDRLHQQLDAMKQAAEENDLGQLAFLAHWLKGSGGTAGFDVFTGPARQLEKLARSGEVAPITDAIVKIQALLDRVQRPAIPGTPIPIEEPSKSAD
jgi:CheY-like chemotaxis protein/HPt (histidine-containing phosphotransfer) domain-containing protein